MGWSPLLTHWVLLSCFSERQLVAQRGSHSLRNYFPGDCVGVAFLPHRSTPGARFFSEQNDHKQGYKSTHDLSGKALAERG